MKIRDFKYLLAYLIPLSALFALLWKSYWSYSTVIFSFGIIPIIEILSKPDHTNESYERQNQKKLNRFFDYLLYLNIPIVYLLTFITFREVKSGVHTIEGIGLLLNLGIVLSTSGINVAHEIGHRQGLINKIAAALLLGPSMYGHFTIEHNYGHHKWIGTPRDPASATENQSVYAFIYQAVTGVYKNAWRISFKQMGKSGLPRFHYRNELVWIHLFQLVLLIVYFIYGGVAILLFGIACAIVSFSLLECIDYIEHYGLRRKLLPSGKYERVNENHSWNSDHQLGRIVLYELTRHADHHANAERHYQTLRYKEESPQLPLGYPASIVLALIPTLWFKKMNPLVTQFQA